MLSGKKCALKYWNPELLAEQERDCSLLLQSSGFCWQLFWHAQHTQTHTMTDHTFMQPPEKNEGCAGVWFCSPIWCPPWQKIRSKSKSGFSFIAHSQNIYWQQIQWYHFKVDSFDIFHQIWKRSLFPTDICWGFLAEASSQSFDKFNVSTLWI